MKRWIIIDDCTSRAAAQWETIIDAHNAQEAEAIARRQWDDLTDHDRRCRDAYYVGYAEIDHAGCVDMDTMTDIIDIK